ncbi:acyclic terpene utilization AtuA family protein [Streptomyces sp. NPDC048111]|uniref:acyclic terpene utilization AtuA family protein n=1 Tax=Streptomyces sp. NPDC048111 TaxID=3365500 RepID=UPI003710E527
MSQNAPILRIGNASGFYGDRFDAMREMLTGGHLDVLTGDYLAELTLLILGRDRLRDPRFGYAKTFLRQLEDCLGLAHERGVRIVTNAGGLNPAGLADAIRELSERVGVPARVAHVEGDALALPEGALTANAYLGGAGIAACLRGGADIVVTGRVTDAALVTGPAAWWFDWGPEEYDALAGAVVAGHVLECGTQATGGNYSFFKDAFKGAFEDAFKGAFKDVSEGVSEDVVNSAQGASAEVGERVAEAGFPAGLPGGEGGAGRGLLRPGFPLAEIHADGSCVITKHPGTGGTVDTGTVTAQLLYETSGARYAGPDVTARLDTVRLDQDGPDRVRITGVRGEAPPPTLKAGITRIGGWRNEVVFVLTGLDVPEKAALVRAQVDDAFARAKSRPAEVRWELARTDHADAPTQEGASALLRLVVRDADAEAVGRVVSGAAIELALGSYPGFHVTAPPGKGAPYGVFSAQYVAAGSVEHVAVRADGVRELIAPPARTIPLSKVPEPPLPPLSYDPTGPTRRVPLGTLLGARSGDKGGDVNVGVWVRSGADADADADADAVWGWVVRALSVELFRELLPEVGGLGVTRHVLPNLRAVNFVVEGLLGEGVASQGRFDPQGKGVGEWLRGRGVEVPVELLG